MRIPVTVSLPRDSVDTGPECHRPGRAPCLRASQKYEPTHAGQAKVRGGIKIREHFNDGSLVQSGVTKAWTLVDYDIHGIRPPWQASCEGPATASVARALGPVLPPRQLFRQDKGRQLFFELLQPFSKGHQAQ